MYIKTPLLSLYLLAHHFIIYSSHVLFCSYFHIAMSFIDIIIIFSFDHQHLRDQQLFCWNCSITYYIANFSNTAWHIRLCLYSLKGSPFALFCLLVLLTKILHCFVQGSLSCPSVNCPVHHSFWLTWPYCPILINLSYVLSGHWMNLH